MTLTDYFAPYNESFLDPPDADLGSGGVTLVPDQSVAPIHVLIGGGKDGTLYLIDRDNMGQFNRSNDDKAVQNLVHGIGGPGTNGVGHQGFKGIWPKAAYWQHQIYYTGVGDVAKAFRLNNGQLSVVPISSSAVTFRYPGGLPAVSANGSANGIVWMVMENTPGQLPAVLYAFDAADLSVELYNSSTETTGIGAVWHSDRGQRARFCRHLKRTRCVRLATVRHAAGWLGYCLFFTARAEMASYRRRPDSRPSQRPQSAGNHGFGDAREIRSLGQPAFPGRI